MPRVLFTANFLENGVYTCHARVGFASARELQDFLIRNTFPERDGWGIVIHRGPSRGYDGKPVYQADIRLSAVLPPPWQPELRVHESAPEGNGYGSDQERPDGTPSEHLTWEQRAMLQKATTALLLQLGISALGC
jgi:hypothetical protein